MLYANVDVDSAENAMVVPEVGASNPSRAEWDNTLSSQAYMGLGGQFR